MAIHLCVLSFFMISSNHPQSGPQTRIWRKRSLLPILVPASPVFGLADCGVVAATERLESSTVSFSLPVKVSSGH